MVLLDVILDLISIGDFVVISPVIFVVKLVGALQLNILAHGASK